MSSNNFEAFRSELAITYIQAYIYLEWFIRLYNWLGNHKTIRNSQRPCYQLCLISFKETAIIKCAKLFDNRTDVASLKMYLNYADKNAVEFQNAAQHYIKEIVNNDRIKLETYKNKIERMQMWRHKRVAHQELEYIDEPENIYKYFPLEIGEFRSLLILSKEIINRYSELYDQKSNVAFIPTEQTLDAFLDLVKREGAWRE